jgi:hypothetical protein
LVALGRRREWAWAVISAGFAIAGVVNPGMAGEGSVTTLVRLYAGTYFVRAVPLAVALVILLARARPAPGLVTLLVLAGAAQAGDAAIGAMAGLPFMFAGGGVYAVIHLATAFWLTRAAPAPPAAT